jgi:hypothetical protein
MESSILVKVFPQVFLVTHQQALKGVSLLRAIYVEVLFEILVLLSSLLTHAGFAALILHGFLTRAIAIQVLEDLPLNVFREVPATSTTPQDYVVLSESIIFVFYLKDLWGLPAISYAIFMSTYAGLFFIIILGLI